MVKRINRRRFLLYAGVTASAAAHGWEAPAVIGAGNELWGDLVGRLLYDGVVPPRKKLVVNKDVWCCGKFDIRDESLLVDADGGLANVFIYARTRNLPICPDLEKTAAKRVTLDNRGCIFQPHCLTLWYPRQEFYIINSDPVAQNVAFGPLGDTPANIVLAVGKDATYTFSRSQILPVPIACNYHPWESGFILPRDNPYAVVSDRMGNFRIPRLPVGKIEFQVWHERRGYVDTPHWPKGRFTLEIKPGLNDLGAVKLSPTGFQPK